MSRSNTQNRSKPSKRKAGKKQFGMEAMEARRLMAGDVSVAADFAIEAEVETRRPAIVAEADTPMPQTREHILLGRQVSIPQVAEAGANPMDLKRGIDTTQETTPEAKLDKAGVFGRFDESAEDGSAAGDSGGDDDGLCKSDGVTVETACDLLGPGVDPDAASGEEADKPKGNLEYEWKTEEGEKNRTLPEVFVTQIDGEDEGRGEKGDVEGELCSNEGVTVETPCDVLGPGVDPDAASGDMPNGNPYDSADEVLAPESEGEEDSGGDDDGLCKSDGVTVETPCDVLGPGVDPDADELPELIAVPPTEDPIPGDTNGDGNVDFSDFLKLSANFGKEVRGGHAAGDFNENDVVDFHDFLHLYSNYGTQAVDEVFASMAAPKAQDSRGDVLDLDPMDTAEDQRNIGFIAIRYA